MLAVLATDATGLLGTMVMGGSSVVGGGGLVCRLKAKGLPAALAGAAAAAADAAVLVGAGNLGPDADGAVVAGAASGEPDEGPAPKRANPPALGAAAAAADDAAVEAGGGAAAEGDGGIPGRTRRWRAFGGEANGSRACVGGARRVRAAAT